MKALLHAVYLTNTTTGSRVDLPPEVAARLSTASDGDLEAVSAAFAQRGPGLLLPVEQEVRSPVLTLLLQSFDCALFRGVALVLLVTAACARLSP